MQYEIIVLSDEILTEYDMSLSKDFKKLKVDEETMVSLIEDSYLVKDLHKRKSTIFSVGNYLAKKFHLSDGNKGGSKSLRVIGIADVNNNRFFLAKVYRKNQKKDMLSKKDYENIKKLTTVFKEYI